MSAHSEYDFIIVGGGTAGCVLANRLSKDDRTSVAVIESGKNLNEDPLLQNPSNWRACTGHAHAWQFESLPQPGLNGRKEAQPQGRLLGGSSAMNGAVFLAPTRPGIDAWARLGNTEWDYDSLEPYLQKAYTLTLPDDEICKKMHINISHTPTQHGPISVSYPALRTYNPVVEAWNKAFTAMGYKHASSLSPPEVCGNRGFSATISPKSGCRSHAGNEHAMIAFARANVTFMASCSATRIIFAESSSNEDKIASAVEIEYANGLRTQLTAKKEVILAAGVFNSSKLLELSGIGSTDILKGLDIPVLISNSSVGENLQNHAMGMILPELCSEVEQATYIQTYAFHKLPDEIRKRLHGEGPPIADSSAQRAHNDAVTNLLTVPNGASVSSGFSFIGVDGYAGLVVVQSVPFSRGNTHITSKDARVPPAIDPQVYSEPLDLEIMAHHMLELEALIASPEMSSIFKKDGKRLVPMEPLNSLEAAKEFLRNTSSLAHHSVGSCAMLPRDAGGVVDQSLRVYGTRNLRVVDASIFPVIPQANPIATVYAVAERAADIIKAGN